MTGFEPATSCSQNRSATKLRYIPYSSMESMETPLPRVYFCFFMQNFLNGDPSIRVSFFFLFCKSVFHQLATQLEFQTSSEKLSDDIERYKMGRGNDFSLTHRDGDEATNLVSTTGTG
jgi:hypothetical protein